MPFPDIADNQGELRAAASWKEAAPTSDAKATNTAKASDELSEDDLEAVAGGKNLNPAGP